MHHSKTEEPGKGLVVPSRGAAAEPQSGSVQSEAAKQQRPLGITAKSSTPPPSERLREARAQRYQALYQARSWMGRRVNVMRPDVQFPGDVYRTFDCRHVRTAHHVGIHKSQAYLQAHYSGIATCGSVWACPVCATKIQERRRLELEHLVQWADDQDLQAIMVTFTFPHASFDTLADLTSKQADAFKRLRAGSPFKRFRESIGYQGLVRSLECTHGGNGWHPHTHELWIVDPSVTDSILARLVELWERACVRAGLLDPLDLAKVEAFRCHSVDVRLQATSGEYLAKQDSSRAWGITHEVAKATSKKGKAKGVHPHEFLIRRSPGDEARYFEYIEAMKGRPQLYWSPGLKDRCGLDDVDDETIAAEQRDEADLLGNLGDEDWKFIQKHRIAAQVLDVAETGGWFKVLVYLKRLGLQTDRAYWQPPNSVT